MRGVLHCGGRSCDCIVTAFGPSRTKQHPHTVDLIDPSGISATRRIAASLHGSATPLVILCRDAPLRGLLGISAGRHRSDCGKGSTQGSVSVLQHGAETTPRAHGVRECAGGVIVGGSACSPSVTHLTCPIHSGGMPAHALRRGGGARGCSGHPPNSGAAPRPSATPRTTLCASGSFYVMTRLRIG